MALDVWYKSDIQNALSAAEQASGAALTAAGNGNDPFVAGYRAGYRAALATVALAFGLAATAPRPQGWQHPWAEGLRHSLAAREAEAEAAVRPGPSATFGVGLSSGPSTELRTGPASRSTVPALSGTGQDGAAQVQGAHDETWEEA